MAGGEEAEAFYHTPLPNGPKWTQMVPNGPKWSQMVPMIPNGPKWSQLVPNGPKLVRNMDFRVYLV